MTLRDRLRDIFDDWKNRLQPRNLLPRGGGRPNYVPHRPVFEDIDPLTGEVTEKTGAGMERDFLKKRIYPTHAEGEANGIEYRTKDAVALAADYIERATNMVARDDLAKSLLTRDMNPRTIQTATGQQAVTLPMAVLDRDANPLTRGYRDSGLSIDQNGQRATVYVNPELSPHLDAVLEARAPKSAILRAALKFSTGAKSLLLSLSPFHWITVTNRMLEANPTLGGLRSIGSNLKQAITMPAPVDYFNLTPEQQFAIDSGVVASSTRSGYMHYADAAEGLAPEHGSLAAKIPYIGRFNKWIEEKLFGSQGFITGLKFDLHEKLTDELLKSQPTLTREAAGRIAADQVNNKFGGLNYTVMGRSASTQNALRSFLLAPDFLESTGRSVLDMAGPHGQQLVKAMVAFNALHYLTARAINYLVSGNYHPESGFKVVSKDGKKEYGLRTTFGDFLHFIQDPRAFTMNRVNPTLVRVPLEDVVGFNPEGGKISDTQKLWDTVRQVTPIPAQGITPKQTVSQPSGTDELLKGFGIQSTKKMSAAETIAYQRATEKGQGGEPPEGDKLEAAQTKFRLADSYRTAVMGKDQMAKEQARKDIDDARKANKISVSDEEQMMLAPYKYPTRLAATVAHLPLEDSLDVYAAAGVQEKRNIRSEIAKKVTSYYASVTSGKHNEKEYKALKPKIDKFFRAKL